MSKVIEAITESDMETSDTQECVTKVCTKCGETKSVNDFYRDKHQKDGRTFSCKVCNLIASRKYRKENLEKIKAVQSCYDYRKAGALRARQWAEKNHDRYREKCRIKEQKRKPKVSLKQKRKCKELHTDYVEKLCAKKYLIKREFIPAEIINIETQRLKILRAIKQQKQIIKELSNAK